MAIEVFIGSEPNQKRAEKVLVHSIRANAKRPGDINIHIMRNGDPDFDDWENHGPTGFTLFRFAVPHLMHFDGLAIYLDCDMLCLGDIEELATYYSPGLWCQHPDPQGDCVSVIDCTALRTIPNWPSIEELKAGKLRKWDVRKKLEPIIKRNIPGTWNSMDRFSEEARLIHYTSIDTQPWRPDPNHQYRPHPDETAEKLWFHWEREAEMAADA